jgi:hypothetical protein
MGIAAVPHRAPRPDPGRETPAGAPEPRSAEMNIQKLDVDALAVESFVTGEPEAAPVAFGQTQRCDTRLTICTIGP